MKNVMKKEETLSWRMNFWHEVKKQDYGKDHIFNILKVNLVRFTPS